jgi:uncharacterized membrane protein
MQTWLVYGILIAFLWGSYAVLTKIATTDKQFGISPVLASLFMLVGIAIVFVAGALTEGKLQIPENKLGIALSILAGILWAIGMFLSIKALAEGADLAKLAPIYNMNTLVAVVLGILLLHELPNSGEMAKVVLGAILIIIGGILVSI